MAGHTATPKPLLALNNGLVMDYALDAARVCGAWPHVIINVGDERVARYLVSKGPASSFSYGLPNLLQSIYMLRKAYEDSLILYIMPDTVFKPIEACEEMMLALDFPVVVGIVETRTPQKLGMCVLTPESEGPRKIIGLADKPIRWDREPFAWAIVAWRAPFWEAIGKTDGSNMTDVLEEAVRMFGPLPTVELDDYIDIGTPEDYERAQREGW